MALAAGKDPVQFRLDMLQKARTNPVGAIKYDIARMETVIKQAAEKSDGEQRKGVAGFQAFISPRILCSTGLRCGNESRVNLPLLKYMPWQIVVK